jgi:SAM-dependent methyltransferase
MTTPPGVPRGVEPTSSTSWGTGDAARVGSLGSIHAELLCEAVDLHAGERVLDVAAGTGPTALAAALRGAEVVAIDLVDHLLDSARRIANANGVALRTQVADAQCMPFDDDAFDVVVSAFGAMFAPDQQAVADEMVRVCRPNGRIGVAAWAPDSLMGDVLTATERQVSRPGDRRSYIGWGDTDGVRELFGNRVCELRTTTRRFTFRHRSAQHVLTHHRAWDGWIKAAFEVLDDDGQEIFEAALLEIYAAENRASDGTVVVASDYLEVVATVR